MTTQVLESLRLATSDFLKLQGADGFMEAAEIQAGVLGHALLIGTVFPVSIVLLALLAEGAPDLVERETRAIMALGAPEGWRYFNLCPEIPPDADDLAQVISLLVKSGRAATPSILEAPIAHLFANRIAPGRFRTWLVQDLSEASGADLAWAAGHDPVHPEVVANVLHALLLLDPARYVEEAIAGADWIAGRACEALWPSYWYYGEGYGTYQALRLFDRLEGLRPELRGRWDTVRQPAHAALLAAQAPDGSWRLRRPPLGFDELRNAQEPLPAGAVLETAWSLSALSFLGRDVATRRAIADGLQFLASRRQEDGGFEAEPFYFTLGLSAYRSRCVTSAAVLMATQALEGHVGG